MSGQIMSLLIFIGLMSSFHLWVCGSVVDVKVRPGDDITVYCDCTLSSGVLVVWYRNCSHLNQPTLVLRLRTKYLHDSRNDPLSWMTPFPRFQFVRNHSSNSYDLLITNISESDAGLYFCGTEMVKLEDTSYLKKTYIYVYGNTSTRIIFNSSEVADSLGAPLSKQPTALGSVVGPAAAVLIANICFILVYHFCQRTDSRDQTRAYKDEERFLTTVVFGTIDRKTQ